MLVSRVFDGITDLIMGYIIDHSKSTKFGKSRKWLLRSCIPFAISGVVVFRVPAGASDIIKYIFVFLTYNLCNSIFYTAVAVSYNTLMVNITRNSLERGILGIFVMVFSTLGGLIVTSSCLALVNFFGGDAAAWTKTIIVYSIIGLAAHLMCIFGTKERIIDDSPAEKEQKAPPQPVRSGGRRNSCCLPSSPAPYHPGVPPAPVEYHNGKDAHKEEQIARCDPLHCGRPDPKLLHQGRKRDIHRRFHDHSGK